MSVENLLIQYKKFLNSKSFSVETVKTYMSGSAATKGFAIAAAIVFG